MPPTTYIIQPKATSPFPYTKNSLANSTPGVFMDLYGNYTLAFLTSLVSNVNSGDLNWTRFLSHDVGVTWKNQRDTVNSSSPTNNTVKLIGTICDSLGNLHFLFSSFYTSNPNLLTHIVYSITNSTFFEVNYSISNYSGSIAKFSIGNDDTIHMIYVGSDSNTRYLNIPSNSGTWSTPSASISLATFISLSIDIYVDESNNVFTTFTVFSNPSNFLLYSTSLDGWIQHQVDAISSTGVSSAPSSKIVTDGVQNVSIAFISRDSSGGNFRSLLNYYYKLSGSSSWTKTVIQAQTSPLTLLGLGITRDALDNIYLTWESYVSGANATIQYVKITPPSTVSATVNVDTGVTFGALGSGYAGMVIPQANPSVVTLGVTYNIGMASVGCVGWYFKSNANSTTDGDWYIWFSSDFVGWLTPTQESYNSEFALNIFKAGSPEKALNINSYDPGSGEVPLKINNRVSAILL